MMKLVRCAPRSTIRPTPFFAPPSLIKLRALAMNQLAGVFADLKLVRALSPGELKRLGKEEERESFSSLTPFRLRWRYDRGALRVYATFSGPIFVATASGVVMANGVIIATNARSGVGIKEVADAILAAVLFRT